jgi:hypothetical protein
MFIEHLFVTASLRIRGTSIDGFDDRLLADAGITRADVLKQKRWFRKGK